MSHDLTQKSSGSTFVPRRSSSAPCRKLYYDQQNVSEFMLDSALTQAIEILTDRRLFLLDDAQWTAFMAALDAPPGRCRALSAC